MAWIWSSDSTNTWPGCGEIDIMEHKEMSPMLFMVLHYPGRSNADGNKITIQMLQLNFMYKNLRS
jgi:hypothetical protein